MSQWTHLPLVLTSDQAAGVLQINRRTLTNMLDRGALAGVKIGKEWRVSRAELVRFVEDTDTKTPSVVTPTQSEAAATVINKGGLLVVRTEPMDNLSSVVKQARKQRVAELIHQAGL